MKLDLADADGGFPSRYIFQRELQPLLLTHFHGNQRSQKAEEEARYKIGMEGSIQLLVE